MMLRLLLQLSFAPVRSGLVPPQTACTCRLTTWPCWLWHCLTLRIQVAQWQLRLWPNTKWQLLLLKAQSLDLHPAWQSAASSCRPQSGALMPAGVTLLAAEGAVGLSLQLEAECAVCTHCPHISPAGCSVA